MGAVTIIEILNSVITPRIPQIRITIVIILFITNEKNNYDDIENIVFDNPCITAFTYCRVSSDKEEQLSSYENQVSYYTNFINSKDEYEFVGIYADEGITGTSTKKRDEFNRMIVDCRNGKIDRIITKSISRFARNTLDCLNYVRELKELGIGVIFEKEGINTLEGSGEVLLTILSSLAQDESRSISENTKWGLRKRYEAGENKMATKRF